MKAHIIAIVSDVHFPHHYKQGWQTFRKWHKEVKPSLTILGGDIIDLSQISRFDVEANETKSVIPSIKMAVTEINQLSDEADRIMMDLGNHEDRWARSLLGGKKQQLAGAIGLDLYSQMRAHGLYPSVQTVYENVEYPGIKIGSTNILVRHGHKKSGRFGVQLIAPKLLRDTPHTSQIVGHFHRCELKAHTSLGKTVVAAANPCMTGDHEYILDPNWQRGFSIVQAWGHDNLDRCEFFTLTPIIMSERGQFAWGGKVYW